MILINFWRGRVWERINMLHHIKMEAGKLRARTIYEQRSEQIRREQLLIGQESELFIHGRNGRIRERDSYGNDQFPPKG